MSTQIKRLNLHLINIALKIFLLKLRLLLFLSVFLSVQAFSQILDDTTKEIYSSKTTKFFIQDDLFTRAGITRTADTSINYLHNYNYQITKDNWYQNLGNMGTAMKPVYFKPPTEIGYRLGFDSYLPYLNTIKEQRYFDTRSPYTELKFAQGTTGEQRLFLLFTRNVNRYWNLGASYNRFTSVKQFAPLNNRDFQADHQQINIFSSIKSRKDKYQALIRFNYMQHWSYESGGVKLLPYESENVNEGGLYLYKYADVRLYRRDNLLAARNYYRTTNLHVYHQFNPLDSGQNQLQFFHEADWTRERQYFRDNNMNIDKAFLTYYGGVNFKDTNMTFYREQVELFENKVGVKGELGKLFYSVYYKLRSYTLADTSQDLKTSGKSWIRFQDSFAGGKFLYRFNDNLVAGVDGEGMTGFTTKSHPDDSNYTAHNDYRWNAYVNYGKFSFSAGQARVSPTFLQTRLVNNVANWSYHKDSLQAVLYRNATISYLHTNGERYFKAGINYQRVDNLIYFRQIGKGTDSLKIKPIQDSAFIDYIQPFIGFRTNWRWVYFENDFVFTNIFTDREIIHMPRWSSIPKLYYQNKLFNKAVDVQAGVELILKADYKGDAYAPQYNTFYWQDNFVVKTFPITNIFINFRLSRAQIFLRVSNIFGDQNYQTGYQETPYYAGMKRSFQFGVFWRAFN